MCTSVWYVPVFYCLDFRFIVRVGSELYVGCSNGELLRFALQADDPNKVCII
jgi:hypothetical protein